MLASVAKSAVDLSIHTRVEVRLLFRPRQVLNYIYDIWWEPSSRALHLSHYISEQLGVDDFA